MEETGKSTHDRISRFTAARQRIMSRVTPGEHFDRYVIRAKFGAGGMADVFLADDTQLGRRVALKFLRPETEADSSAKRRLLREARAAATLVSEVGDIGRPYIAMQYVEGEVLDTACNEGRWISLRS